MSRHALGILPSEARRRLKASALFDPPEGRSRIAQGLYNQHLPVEARAELIREGRRRLAGEDLRRDALFEAKQTGVEAAGLGLGASLGILGLSALNERLKTDLDRFKLEAMSDLSEQLLAPTYEPGSGRLRAIPPLADPSILRRQAQEVTGQQFFPKYMTPTADDLTLLNDDLDSWKRHAFSAGVDMEPRTPLPDPRFVPPEEFRQASEKLHKEHFRNLPKEDFEGYRDLHLHNRGLSDSDKIARMGASWDMRWPDLKGQWKGEVGPSPQHTYENLALRDSLERYLRGQADVIPDRAVPGDVSRLMKQLGKTTASPEEAAALMDNILVTWAEHDPEGFGRAIDPSKHTDAAEKAAAESRQAILHRFAGLKHQTQFRKQVGDLSNYLRKPAQWLMTPIFSPKLRPAKTALGRNLQVIPLLAATALNRATGVGLAAGAVGAGVGAAKTLMGRRKMERLAEEPIEETLQQIEEADASVASRLGEQLRTRSHLVKARERLQSPQGWDLSPLAYNVASLEVIAPLLEGG